MLVACNTLNDYQTKIAAKMYIGNMHWDVIQYSPIFIKNVLSLDT